MSTRGSRVARVEDDTRKAMGAGQWRAWAFPPFAGHAVGLVALVATGCGSEALDDGAIGERQDPVMNGTLTNDEINIGLRLPGGNACNNPPGGQGWFNCSSTLLRNDMILTSAHCFQTDNPPPNCGAGCPPPDVLPENMTAVQHPTLQCANDVLRTGAVFGYQQHSSLDVAVMNLASPFTVNGSTLGHSVPLWGGLEANLDTHVGLYTHNQRGYGYNNCANSDTEREWTTTTPDFTNSAGDFRWMGYNVQNNQIADNVDSGSSYRWVAAAFPNFWDRPVLAVTTWETGFIGCPTTSWGLKVTRFRDWVHAWLSGYDTTITETYSTNVIGSYTLYDAPGATGGPSIWSISGGELIQTQNVANGGTYAIDNRIAVSNAQVRSRIFSADNDSAGVVARWRNSCYHYLFYLDDQNNRAKIVRTYNCVQTVLKDVPFSFNWNNSGNGHDLTFWLFGKRLKGLVDGIERISVDDTVDATGGWITAGKIGLFNSAMGDPDVRYRDLQYTPDNSFPEP